NSFRGLWLKGGAPKIANNTISYSLFGIYIAEWSGTEPRVVDNILINNYCGLHVEKLVKGLYTRNNIISFNCYGIRINRSSPSITLELQGDMIFNNSEYGIHMMAVQAYIEPLQKITATNLTICNNPVGIALRACEPTFSNSSITNNTYDALLSESATLKFINTSIGCVNITDTTSKLEVYVYLTASVKWQTGAGVENATVAIYDKYDVEVFRGLTDRNGVCTAELLTNYINHSADRGYSPYTINASISVIFSKTELVIAKTKLLTVWTAAGSREVKYVATFMERCELILYDLTLPTISVEPPLFAITNSATLKISGTAWDNMGLYNWTVDKGASAFWVRVNKGAWNALKPDCRMLKFEVVGGRIINSTIEWSGIVNLVKGENWIELRVADETYDLINGTGNTAIANLSAIMGMPITLDTTPPVITEIIVEYSSYNKTYNLTNASAEFINSTLVNLKLSIKGENSENVTIWVNLDNYLIRLNSTGEAWLKTDNITLTLGYNAITIIVSDELGNRFSYSIKLLVADQLAPASLITYPFKDHVNSILEVAGFAQDDISGVATVYIRIYNKSGNTNWWKDKWITKESWLEVELKGERYEKWSLNTAGVKWLDGCEYWIYTKASDRANNTEKEHYKIFTYDTTKPFIDIPIQDGYRTAENYLKISGRTESGASIVVNGMSVAVDELGSFSLELKLGEGSNIITIVACDTAGNINELTITIEKYTEVPLITPALIMLIWIVAGTLLAGIIAVIIATSVKIKPRIKAPKAKLPTVPAVPKEEQPVPERRYF
ncbi:MAG: hypothetical protein QMD21_06880, partial [Candidatus Thermoplasmatota archaeon]|nr:hypothetical protein [Candidatus Thermoplasmatota archaeon]